MCLWYKARFLIHLQCIFHQSLFLIHRNESIAYQEQLGVDDLVANSSVVGKTDRKNIAPIGPMRYILGSDAQQETPDQEIYLPIWQSSPYLPIGTTNINILRNGQLVHRVIDQAIAIMGQIVMYPAGSLESSNPQAAIYSALESIQGEQVVSYTVDPMATLYIPVFDCFDHARRKVVGVLSALIRWSVYFEKVLPESTRGVVVVLHSDECSDDSLDKGRGKLTQDDGKRDLLTNIVIKPSIEPQQDDNPDEGGIKATQESVGDISDDLLDVDPDLEPDESFDADPGLGSESTPPQNHDHEGDHGRNDTDHKIGDGYFTYVLDGSEVRPLGFGDLHDPRFDKWGRTTTFLQKHLPDGTAMGTALDRRCSYRINVYPSQDFLDEYQTTAPYVITATMVSVFAFAILLFLFYDCLVERRQEIVLKNAAASSAIVSSLFPKNVRDRLMADEDTARKQVRSATSKGRIKGFLAGDDASLATNNSNATIADLFPHCTVFFGDIAGAYSIASDLMAESYRKPASNPLLYIFL